MRLPHADARFRPRHAVVARRCSLHTRRPLRLHALQARDEEPQQLQPELLYPSNIMFDRRVVRGNTYAARVLPAEPAILSGGGGKAGTIPA